MKKRIAALAMAGLMVLSAAGCGPQVNGGDSEGKSRSHLLRKRRCKR